MKCYFCDSKRLHCAEQKGLVIADPEFYCDYICNGCIYVEEEK